MRDLELKREIMMSETEITSIVKLLLAADFDISVICWDTVLSLNVDAVPLAMEPSHT